MLKQLELQHDAARLTAQLLLLRESHMSHRGSRIHTCPLLWHSLLFCARHPPSPDGVLFRAGHLHDLHGIIYLHVIDDRRNNKNKKDLCSIPFLLPVHDHVSKGMRGG